MIKLIKKIRSGDMSCIRSEIVHAIMNGKLGKSKVKIIIRELQNSEVGNKYLSSHTIFQICNDNSKWNPTYLRKIGEAIICGDMTEELLCHMVEVKCYVHRNYRYAFWIIFMICLIGVSIFVFEIKR